LAKTNLRIALLESTPLTDRQQPSYDDRSVALAWTSQKILDGLGVWSLIANDTAAIQKIHISARGSFTHTCLHSEQEQIPALGYVVENRVLGNAFQQLLNQQPNLTFFCPASLFRLQQDKQTVSVDIQQAEQTRHLTGRLLVAADGLHSRVVNLLGLTKEAYNYKQYAIISNITAEYPHKGIAFERFTDDGAFALLPLTQGRCSLVWTLPENQLASVMAMDDSAFLQSIQAIFGYRLGKLLKTGKRFRYALQSSQLSQLYQQRTVILGNAAHVLHPIAGQGFNLGLRDAALLAELIHQGEMENTDELLKVYQQQRKKDINTTLQWTHKLIQLFNHKNHLIRFARNGGFALMECFPSIKHKIARNGGMGIGKYSRLACGLELS
jgi:2-octaprenyl-6-methoxyphenol hydroxylase